SLSAGGSPIGAEDYIAYWDAARKNLRLATWDGSQWADEVIDGGQGDVAGQFVSLAVDRTPGPPAMAYLDASQGAIRCAFWSSGWVTHTVDAGLQGISDISLSLALFSAQYPRIAYTDKVDKSLRLAWSTVPTTTWTVETVAAFNFDPTGIF